MKKPKYNILQAFDKKRMIDDTNSTLLINSSNASSISYCLINGTKYKVSTSELNRILNN